MKIEGAHTYGCNDLSSATFVEYKEPLITMGKAMGTGMHNRLS